MGTHPIFESDFDCLTDKKHKREMGFETSGPNEAMIVSGFGYTSPAMIPGGRVWVWPCVQQIQRISLNTMTLQIDSDHVNTKQGVPISCIGVAQVKVESRQEQMLSTAYTHFLGKDEETIRSIALETMEGHQRAIMGQMTVEEIYQDRKAFSVKVFEVASTDLMNMGIFVVSYTLKDIREHDLRKAENKKEVETQKAIEKLAHALQEAKTMQDLKNEEMKIEIVKRTRQIELQDQEILRREKELEATVMKPAEAEKYRVEKIAQADKERSILEAEAEAESIRIRGEAKAFAIQQRSSAEAEQMRKKALAWQQYQEAAMVDMVLKTLPQIAAEIAAPLARANKVTMVSSGGGEIGAAKLTGEVLDVVRRLPAVVEAMTGVQLMPTK